MQSDNKQMLAEMSPFDNQREPRYGTWHEAQPTKLALSHPAKTRLYSKAQYGKTLAQFATAI
jgi:hypothetical protein